MIKRNAQLVALIHFMTGAGNEVTFSRMRFANLPNRHKEGLDELLNEKMIKRHTSRLTVKFTALPAIGCPIRDFERMKESENWVF